MSQEQLPLRQPFCLGVWAAWAGESAGFGVSSVLVFCGGSAMDSTCGWVASLLAAAARGWPRIPLAAGWLHRWWAGVGPAQLAKTRPLPAAVHGASNNFSGPNSDLVGSLLFPAKVSSRSSSNISRGASHLPLETEFENSKIAIHLQVVRRQKTENSAQ